MPSRRYRAKNSVGTQLSNLNQTAEELEKRAASGPEVASVPGAALQENAVTDRELATNSVGDDQIKPGAVGTNELGIVNKLKSDSWIELNGPNYTGSGSLSLDSDGRIVIGGGGGSSVTVSTSPPSVPAEGDLWWDEDNGKLFIFYTDGTSDQWVEVTNSSAFGSLPVGSIIDYPADAPVPAYALLCDGAAASRTIYTSLYGLIGTDYGSGDGSTTFNVPDLYSPVIAFEAGLTANHTKSGAASWGAVPFTNELFDTVGCYDAASAVFTAPVAGVYEFSLSTVTSTSTGGPLYRFRINGETLSTVDFDVAGYSDAYSSSMASRAYQLDAGDTVEAWLYNANGVTTTMPYAYGNRFSGHLVSSREFYDDDSPTKKIIIATDQGSGVTVVDGEGGYMLGQVVEFPAGAVLPANVLAFGQTVDATVYTGLAALVPTWVSGSDLILPVMPPGTVDQIGLESWYNTGTNSATGSVVFDDEFPAVPQVTVAAGGYTDGSTPGDDAGDNVYGIAALGMSVQVYNVTETGFDWRVTRTDTTYGPNTYYLSWTATALSGMQKVIVAADGAGEYSPTVQASLVTAINTGYRYVDTVVFTASGTFNKADYPWLRAIRVRACGAGAAGGGRSATLPAGGGGGGGGTAESFITDIAGLAASLAVTIGAGGAAVSAGNGNGGGNTSLDSLVIGEGGAGGAIAYAGGAGGFGTGDIVYPGSRGGAGRESVNAGYGGDSLYGQGAPNRTSSIGTGNGTAGAGYGAGGSGGYGTVSGSGGAGTDGILYVELYA